MNTLIWRDGLPPSPGLSLWIEERRNEAASTIGLFVVRLLHISRWFKIAGRVGRRGRSWTRERFKAASGDRFRGFGGNRVDLGGNIRYCLFYSSVLNTVGAVLEVIIAVVPLGDAHAGNRSQRISTEPAGIISRFSELKTANEVENEKIAENRLK